MLLIYSLVYTGPSLRLTAVVQGQIIWVNSGILLFNRIIQMHLVAMERLKAVSRSLVVQNSFYSIGQQWLCLLMYFLDLWQFAFKFIRISDLISVTCSLSRFWFSSEGVQPCPCCTSLAWAWETLMSGEGSSHDAGNFLMSLIILLNFFSFSKMASVGEGWYMWCASHKICNWEGKRNLKFFNPACWNKAKFITTFLGISESSCNLCLRISS